MLHQLTGGLALAPSALVVHSAAGLALGNKEVHRQLRTAEGTCRCAVALLQAVVSSPPAPGTIAEPAAGPRRRPRRRGKSKGKEKKAEQESQDMDADVCTAHIGGTGSNSSLVSGDQAVAAGTAPADVDSYMEGGELVADMGAVPAVGAVACMGKGKGEAVAGNGTGKDLEDLDDLRRRAVGKGPEVTHQLNQLLTNIGLERVQSPGSRQRRRGGGIG